MKIARATDQFSSVLHADLRRVVKGVMTTAGERPLLEPAAVLTEVFLRMAQSRRGIVTKPADWQSRARFTAAGAQQLRLTLRSYSCRRNASPLLVQLTFHGYSEKAHNAVCDFVAIDRSLSTLALSDAALAELMELSCFGGMTDREIAFVREISAAKARSDKECGWEWLSKTMAIETLACFSDRRI